MVNRKILLVPAIFIVVGSILCLYLFVFDGWSDFQRYINNARWERNNGIKVASNEPRDPKSSVIDSTVVNSNKHNTANSSQTGTNGVDFASLTNLLWGSNYFGNTTPRDNTPSLASNEETPITANKKAESIPSPASPAPRVNAAPGISVVVYGNVNNSQILTTLGDMTITIIR